jgi:Double-GTPase 2
MAMPPAHYDQVAAGAINSLKLLSQVTCPHCWEHFSPEDVLWVSEHVDLLGDALLGRERQQRFLPSRYTLQGDAIDSKGMTSRSLACPKCHLPIPRAMLEMESLFISILGAPGSGKSYFLTAMTWQLRQVLPLNFKIAFTDADPEANRALNEWEEKLFLNSGESEVVPLAALIGKTELHGGLYDTVAYGQQTVSYPRPFQFTMQPQDGHPGGDPARLARMLCLYDNAGEHFQPGQDTATSPVTRHLAKSRAILFLFDPTQDPRFRAVCRNSESAGASQRAARLSRQETILNEAASRIRRHAGMSHGTKYERPLVVVVTKLDEWSHLLDPNDRNDPWRAQGNLTGVDVAKIEQMSSRVREILLKYCPETVTAVESFAQDVTYVAASALGGQVELDLQSGLPGIRPKTIRPQWVIVPILFAISRVLPALVPRLVRRSKRADAV